MKLKLALGMALGLTLMAGASQAATSITSTFQVKISIGAACVFSTGAASDMDFGPQTLLTSVINQTSAINVQCTNTTPYTIGLNGGSVANSVTARQMKSLAGAFVNYSLFRDAAHTSNWGNTIGTDTLSGIGTGATVIHTVYGQVPVQTTPATGAYADTVTVTVTY